MVKYKCLRCGYETELKTGLKRHLRRKFKCSADLNNISVESVYNHYYPNEIKDGKKMQKKSNQNEPFVSQNKPKVSHQEPKTESEGDSEFECEFCGKNFAHRQSLHRHVKKRCKKNRELTEYNDLKELVGLLNNQLKQQKEELKQQKKEHKKHIEILMKKTGVNIGTLQNINNTQNNIKILAYNNTDISHLTDKDYVKILNRGSNCIPKLLEAIHFNPKKPENHNIYIPNIKNNYVMAWDGNNWNLHNRSSVLDEMYEDKSNILIDKIEEWIEIGFKLNPIIMKKFQRFLDKKEKDEIKNGIKEEIKLILYNNRKVIDSDNKALVV